MGSLNKAMLIGRLGKDPEVRYTQNNTAVATLSIATSERYKDNNNEWQERTEWHRCVAWARTAEVCEKYLKKGSQVFIEGPIQTRQWEKDGQKQYTTEIKIQVMQMLDSKGASNSGSGYDSGSSDNHGKTPNTEPANINTFGEEDDDLPF